MEKKSNKHSLLEHLFLTRVFFPLGLRFSSSQPHISIHSSVKCERKEGSRERIIGGGCDLSCHLCWGRERKWDKGSRKRRQRWRTEGREGKEWVDCAIEQIRCFSDTKRDWRGEGSIGVVEVGGKRGKEERDEGSRARWTEFEITARKVCWYQETYKWPIYFSLFFIMSLFWIQTPLTLPSLSLEEQRVPVFALCMCTCVSRWLQHFATCIDSPVELGQGSSENIVGVGLITHACRHAAELDSSLNFQQSVERHNQNHGHNKTWHLLKLP